MSKIILTEELARASGTTEADRNMRRAGRKVWNADDYNAAVKEFDRLIPFLPAEDRFRLTGRE